MGNKNEATTPRSPARKRTARGSKAAFKQPHQLELPDSPPKGDSSEGSSPETNQVHKKSKMTEILGKDKDPVTVGVLKKMFEHYLGEVTKKMADLEEENKALKARVQILEDDREKDAAYSRLRNVIVSGIPENETEDPLEVAIMAAKAVGVDLHPSEVEAAHRLPSGKNDSVSPFIMKLVSRFKRTAILRAAKAKKINDKPLGGDGKTKVYYNDHLTKKQTQLWISAKKLWESFVVWKSNGLIWCRGKVQGSPRIKLRSVEDIEKLKNSTSSSAPE